MVIYLGISLFHTGIYQASLVQWITPVAVVTGVIVLLDVILTLWAVTHGEFRSQDAQVHSAKVGKDVTGHDQQNDIGSGLDRPSQPDINVHVVTRFDAPKA